MSFDSIQEINKQGPTEVIVHEYPDTDESSPSR